MAAHLEDPSGKAAGRVTITSTLTSLIPPFFAVLVVVVCALQDILSAETAGAVVLGILATAGLTAGTGFATAKRTPTDQTKVVYSSSGYDQVVPEVAPVAVAPAPTGSTALATEDPSRPSATTPLPACGPNCRVVPDGLPLRYVPDPDRCPHRRLVPPLTRLRPRPTPVGRERFFVVA